MKIVLFCSFRASDYLNCLNYDISTNSTSEIQTIYHQCGSLPISIIMEYFYETENFIVGCKEVENVVYLNEFSHDMIKSQNDSIYNSDYFPNGNIGRINIVIPQGGNKYNFFFNPNPPCYNINCTLSENVLSELGSELSDLHNYPITEPSTLICNVSSYYNYDHTECINTIPPGFYINSTTERTIDKCHQNCQTCDKGPTNDNHNCLTCYNLGTYFFDYGNCVTECSTGHFTHNGIEKCKCSTDTTCEYCSEESKLLNLCETCNINYYPKKDDIYNNGSFIKCYNNDSISNGYYLNITTNQYEPCHENCLKCSGTPTDSNDNCITCIEGLSLIKNIQNIENCYLNCNYYYYFDENNEYHCTNTSICPDGYKLIDGKGKCIDVCSNDNIFNYKYEYNNVCYQNCPGYTKPLNSGSFLCQLKCEDFDKFYNFDQTDCIDNIEEGYYCNDYTLKTIARCHPNCKTCLQGGTDSNNNCNSCPDSGKKYLNLGNCTYEYECILGIFIDEDSILKCKCLDIKCKECTELSLNEGLCISCNNEEGYYPKFEEERNNDGFINCYKNPSGYFLITIDGEQYYEKCYETCSNCIELGDEINNKCTECIQDYGFKYDFENAQNCYEICSDKYYFDSDRKHFCIDQCPSAYNKLIGPKKRCIDDCSKDNSNLLYEYNNECFSECPNNTHTNSDNPYKCFDNLNCELEGRYYNYEGTACIDNIPSGFYCNNNDTKTIDRCHNNCKTCILGPTDENNNCETCKDEGAIYFDLGNCRDNCINGYFVENSINKCKCSSHEKCLYCSKESSDLGLCVSCNEGYYQKKDDTSNQGPYINCYNRETIPKNYFLNDDNKYEACHSNCETCEEKGSDENNKCTNCKSGFSFIKNNNNITNCYQDCNKYYYFDQQNNYHCVDKCPDGTKNLDNNKLCVLSKEDHCPDDFPYFNFESKKCVQNCSASDLFNRVCSTDNPNKNVKQDNFDNIRKGITSKELNPLLDNVINNDEDLLIDDEDIKYQITTTSNQNNKEYDDISTIKLGECENKLKDFYKIKKEDPLIILKMDYSCEGLLSPIVMYEVYHPITKEKLDLIHCQDVQINISLPVQIDEDELFKHDPSNQFYNDICSTFTTESGTDITLNDRQNEFINNNLSLCEDGCDYTDYDTKTKKVTCNCNVKTDLSILSDIKIDKDKLKNKFMDVKSLINLEIMKCYKVLFTKEGLIKNIGSYIILSFIFYYIVSSNLFYLIEYDIISHKIQQIAKIKEKNNKNENDDIIKKDKKKKKKLRRNNGNYTNVNINSIYSTSKVNALNKKNSRFKKKISNPTNKDKKKNKKRKSKTIINNSNKSKSNVDLKNNIIVNYSRNSNKLQTNNNGNITDKNNILQFNDYELNSMDYNQALKYDKRNYIQYYWSLLRTKHILIFAFIPSNDYNSIVTKICLFFFAFALYYTINGLFFTDSTIHEIYEEKGKYNFIYQLPKIIYSSIISSFFSIIVRFVSLFEKSVLKFKNDNNNDNLKTKMENLMKKLRIKFIWFFNLSLCSLILFWYYLSCFCAIYKNTQIHLLKDTLISFSLSLLYPLGIYLIPGLFRIPSLKNNKACMYKVSKIIQLL